jgi:uncharacterized protein YyaL (SSP411 family)
MMKTALIFPFVLLMAGSLMAAPNSPLKNHPSPYLAMHADDPVAWQLWGPEVLEQARRDNKLIFLSLGYFSCHWCHVMQRESYSDPEVGKVMNAGFIAVKVDRELRPELDRRMIRFVEAVRGQAGWPLNVFLTPDGYPVTGFTYLPRDDFLKVLRSLEAQWKERHVEISGMARQYFEQTEAEASGAELVDLPDRNFGKLVDALLSQAMLAGDELQGGFGDGSKFPSYPQLSALLELAAGRKEAVPELEDFLRLTLDVMASRHLMDHVNDGFFRYTTDPDWQTPHFEKMLYDNAQLVMLYLQAERLYPGRGYAAIALRTLDFLDRQLLDAGNGLYASSLSAVDENNVEGGAYWWTLSELKRLLDQQAYRHLVKAWKLDPDSSEPFLARPLVGIGADDGNQALNRRILERLRQADKPSMPVDIKQLASWNALALRARVAAAASTGDPRQRKRAQALYQAISGRFLDGDDVSRFAGAHQVAETTLEDYAQMAAALAAYGREFRDRQAAAAALRLAARAFERYYRNGNWYQDDRTLIPGDPGMAVIPDEVLQSPVPLLLEVVLEARDPPPALERQARELLRRLTRDMLDLPFYHATAIMLRQRLQDGREPAQP